MSAIFGIALRVKILERELSFIGKDTRMISFLLYPIFVI